MLNGLNGLKHISLYTYDIDASVEFYRDVIGMEIASAPDERNVYLKSHGTVLALHERKSTRLAKAPQVLDHIAFTLDNVSDVMVAHLELKHTGLTCTDINKHHDGSVGFYTYDPCGNSVEIIYLGGVYA